MHSSFSLSSVFFFFGLLSLFDLSFISCSNSSNSSAQCVDYSNRCLTNVSATSLNNSSMIMISCCSPTALCDASTNYYCIEPSVHDVCKPSGDRCASNFTSASGRRLLYECCNAEESCIPIDAAFTDYRCLPTTVKQSLKTGDYCSDELPLKCSTADRCFANVFSNYKQCLPYDDDPQKGFKRYQIMIIAVTSGSTFLMTATIVAIIYWINKCYRHHHSSANNPQSSDMKNVAPSQLV